ncbi:hypothetical protein [Paraglaciecola sp. L1A13]|uniref:hypothetical protein n=1 Tax=Paraglaciecola sp. L1A13 TaxID=2686359 RepID=UPI00131B0A76|nr:hypothetical protein [Paraglaciecola sp. L1A13]
MRSIHQLFIAIVLIPLASASLAAELDIGYDSKYVSEGRNNLPEGGIVWINFSYPVTDEISLSAAYGEGESSKYDELNVGLEYSHQWNDFALFANYTRLEFFKDNSFDNEFGTGAAWSGSDWITPSLNVVYSTQADGSFLELGLEQEYQINPHFSINPYARVTFDYGYASDEFDGHNHTYFGIIASHALNDTFSISATLEHNISGNNLKNVGGEYNDKSWGGLHISAVL